MIFTKEELVAAIDQKDLRIKNFLETFGFVVVRGLIDSNEIKKLSSEYDRQLESRIGEVSVFKMLFDRIFHRNGCVGFKAILRRVLRSRGILFVGNFFDHSKILTRFFFSENFTKYFEYFAGKNWIYYGSDGQKYVRSGFSWHRDWNARPPVYKMFFNMTEFPQFGGEFMVIPGTQFVDDVYAQRISNSMMWPLACQDYHDGMSENNFLVRIKNPREYFERFSKKLKSVPSVKVKLKKGDALIFNTSLPHNLSQGFPDIDIKMMSILFAPNPLDNNSSDIAKEDLDYLIDLMVNERNHCRVEPYGPELIKHDFFARKNHFIDVIETNDKYVGGRLIFNGIKHERFIPFDYYADLGKKYRKDMSSKLVGTKASTVFGSYSDVHLGIMCRFLKFNRDR